VGLLVGRYLPEYALARAVVDDAFAGWLRSGGEPNVSVEQWWDQYVDQVESVVGGFDCCEQRQLEDAWHAHARQLIAPRPRTDPTQGPTSS
jgi:hypothetical protein